MILFGACLLAAAMLDDLAFGAEAVKADGAPAPAVSNVTENAKATNRLSRITSDSTFYDRKNGYAVFKGHVYVEDAEYLLHADQAYVLLDATNALKRVIAIGNVAITNGTRRAYGAKAAYYSAARMVALSAGDGIQAEVRDAAKDGEQVVAGEKIKFWLDSEQVEVSGAQIQTPVGGDTKALKLKR